MKLAALLPGRQGVEVIPDLGQALERALQPGVRLVVCGSIYLIGEVRKRLRENFGVPPPASGPLFSFGPTQKFLTLQISLRTSAEIFDTPNFLAKLRRKIRSSKSRCEAPQKNLKLQIPLRSSKKIFGAPNWPAKG